MNAAGIAAMGLIVALYPTPPSWAQTPMEQAKAADEEARPGADRKKAMELFNAHQHLEALPLLEELAEADPNDRVVQERLAIALFTKSATVGADEGRALRRRGRSILVEMKKSGPLSELGGVLVEGVPEDGGVPTFSNKSDAQAAMKEGEAAFARREFDAARRAYQRALALDPTLYHAPLFVGDTYFVQGQLQPARTWFRRAILIDPDKEVAHRYLADALVKAGQAAAARLCYIDAVVAQPYVRQPWLALAGWARANQVTLSHPRIVPEDLEGDGDAGKPRESKESPQEPGRPDDGHSRWRLYRETREAWKKDRFHKTFPRAVYRHSLAEEADALRQVARAIAADVNAGRIKQPDPCFANLMQLDKEGLLEAYILIARPDDGISQDYDTYRATHRSELRRYLKKYVAPFGNADLDEESIVQARRMTDQ
jgi:tetratricopeptide (TPR) repeat protein